MFWVRLFFARLIGRYRCWWCDSLKDVSDMAKWSPLMAQANICGGCFDEAVSQAPYVLEGRRDTRGVTRTTGRQG